MKHALHLMTFFLGLAIPAASQNDTINIDGNNTSSNYVSYNNYISLPSGKIKNILMARYCYFSSTISGSGTLNLYAGGERCYLGTAKAAAFYNLAIRLKQSSVPINGVGLQCHFSIGEVDSVKLESTVKRFAEAGLKCIITELDMGIPSTSDEDLTEQARNYRVITDIVLNNDNCPHLMIWGLKDNDSWRTESSPLLYTAQLSRKPAWYAVRSALRHRKIIKEQTEIKTIPDTNRISGFIYDLSGRHVSGTLAPGIYIQDGKKIFIH